MNKSKINLQRLHVGGGVEASGRKVAESVSCLRCLSLRFRCGEGHEQKNCRIRISRRLPR